MGDSVTEIRQSLVLVGFMAAGKTRIGRLLAERLGLPFVDTDKSIEQSFGLPVADIFRERGEPEFRKAERALIASLLAGEPKVVSIGGGAFLDAETRGALLAGARTIWLDPPFGVVLARLARSGSKRPLAAGKTPEDIRRLWEARRPFYAQAHVRIATSGGDPETVVKRILDSV